MRLFKRRRRLTAEEQRLAEHTALMGRVQGDIVIKPIPYVTQETLEQAVAQEFTCHDCGAAVESRFGRLCDGCRLLDSQVMSGRDGFMGLRLHGNGLDQIPESDRAAEVRTWAKDHVPIGVEVVDGRWVTTNPVMPRRFGHPREVIIKPLLENKEN